MKCWKCGADVEGGDLYCNVCGANLHQGPKAPPGMDNAGASSNDWDFGGSHSDWDSPGGGAGFLKAFALVCAVFYSARAVMTLLSFVRSLLFGYLPWFAILRTVLFGGLLVLLGFWMCLVLIMLAFRRTPQNSDGLLLCLGGGAAGLILVRVLGLLVNVAAYPGSFSSQLQLLLHTVLGATVTVGGVCLLLRFVLGELPFVGKDSEDLRDLFQKAFSSLGQAAGEPRSRRSRQQRQYQNPNQDPYGQTGQQYQDPYRQPDACGQNPPPGGNPFRLKEDRSFPLFILLTIVTCGIYYYYTVYTLARDVNAACHGDGQNTPGLLQFILLSLITCGFYSFYWYYALGNRLFNNGPRYGLNIQETGATLLIWMLLGLLFCNLGYLAAIYFVFRNTNAICAAYNYNHGY